MAAVFLLTRRLNPRLIKKENNNYENTDSNISIRTRLIFTGSAQAGTAVYNSKTTQNASLAASPYRGGGFDGSYLSSKAGSGLVGPSQEEVAGSFDRQRLRRGD